MEQVVYFFIKDNHENKSLPKLYFADKYGSEDKAFNAAFKDFIEYVRDNYGYEPAGLEEYRKRIKNGGPSMGCEIRKDTMTITINIS